MNSRPALEIVSLTHSGLVRSHNEDNHLVDLGAGFVILADGMGGYNAGEVASAMAVSELAAGLSAGLAADSNDADLIRREVERINAVIYAASRGQPQYSGMGTTLVAGVFRDGQVTVAHVGDSRLYRCRGERFGTVTRDHSVLQEQIDGGIISAAEARLSQNKNLVTRALGVDPAVVAEVAVHETAAGDLYLLCSDGLNDMVADEHIEQVLRTNQADLQLAARQLIQMANDNGGRDNVTVILVRVLATVPAPGVLARLGGWIRQSL
jgi:serine/threonine protein phosphatase PrpC